MQVWGMDIDPWWLAAGVLIFAFLMKSKDVKIKSSCDFRIGDTSPQTEIQVKDGLHFSKDCVQGGGLLGSTTISFVSQIKSVDLSQEDFAKLRSLIGARQKIEAIKFISDLPPVS